MPTKKPQDIKSQNNNQPSLVSKNLPMDSLMNPSMELPSIKDKLSDKNPDEDLLRELLRVAMDTSGLDGKTLIQKIEKILDIRLKNELMITSLLNVGVKYDQMTVDSAAGINNKSKDSLSELVKIKQLLEGLPTEHIRSSKEEQEELFNIKNRVFSAGQ